MLQLHNAPMFTRQCLSVALWDLKQPKNFFVQRHRKALAHTTPIFSVFLIQVKIKKWIFDQKMLIYIPKTVLAKYECANGILLNLGHRYPQPRPCLLATLLFLRQVKPRKSRFWA